MIKSNVGQPNANALNSTSTSGDTTSSASSADMNAGPHRSNLANKLDPRVDSDLDNSANQGTAGFQRNNVGNAPQTLNPSNMNQQQSYNQGSDRHTSSDDDFSKSTQEHRSHRQPGQYDQTGTGAEEVDFSSSTQEHKSHKTSSHMTPCTSNPAEGGPISQNNNPAQANFGGNAAGGSSYNQNMGMDTGMGMGTGGSGGQYNNAPFEKSNAAANMPSEQQNVGGQRGY
ncbi:hypothetical protein VI817_008865 [Penicillium citrinum]|nr:hypothetical protein VI817_008865 [Penicillium citrinum]